MDALNSIATKHEGINPIQFAVLLDLNPEKAQTPPPTELREAEFEVVGGFYMIGLCGRYSSKAMAAERQTPLAWLFHVQ